MVNYSKTQELFNKEPKKSPDLKYKDAFPAGFFGDEMAEERWFSQVKNPNTGEFFQLENLQFISDVLADSEVPKGLANAIFGSHYVGECSSYFSGYKMIMFQC